MAISLIASHEHTTTCKSYFINSNNTGKMLVFHIILSVVRIKGSRPLIQEMTYKNADSLYWLS